MEELNLQELQWGHALSGMDTLIPRAKLAASYLLQWGHALSGMDTYVGRTESSLF